MLDLGVKARARFEGGGDVKAEKWKVKEAKGAAAPLKLCSWKRDQPRSNRVVLQWLEQTCAIKQVLFCL